MLCCQYGSVLLGFFLDLTKMKAKSKNTKYTPPKYPLTASTEVKTVSCSQVLLIKQFAGLVYVNIERKRKWS